MFGERASDGVTRKTRLEANARHCTSGQRTEHFSKVEGVLDEGRGPGERASIVSVRPIRGVLLQYYYDHQSYFLYRVGLFARGVS